MSPRPLSLRTHVALVIALVVTLLAGSLSVAVSLRATASMRATLGSGLVEIAHQVADELARGVSARGTPLRVVAGLDVLRPPHDTRRVREVLDHLRRQVDAFEGVALLGPGGRVIASSGTFSLDPGAPAAPHPLAVTAPVRDAEDRPQGLLVAHLRWSWAEDLRAAVLVPFARRHALDVVVIDQSGLILLGPGPLLGRSLSVPIPAQAGWSVVRWPDGRSSLTGFAPPPAVGDGAAPAWRVVAREPVATALAPVDALQRAIILWGGALALVFAGLGWLSAGWVVAPLTRIAEAANRVRAGQRHDLPLVAGPREIETLSMSLRALVHDLLHREAALLEMEDRVQTDPLTGLLNRTGLVKGLEMLIPPAAKGGTGVGARRADDGVACLFIDLDGFKAINDTHGHAAGDTLLRAVAHRLERCLRGRDMICRLGGDEFVMLLRVTHQTGVDEATVVAERAIAAVNAPIALGEATVGVGCSIGIALWPDDARTAEELLQVADEALYEAKRRGRNRACLAVEREAAAAEEEEENGEDATGPTTDS